MGEGDVVPYGIKCLEPELFGSCSPKMLGALVDSGMGCLNAVLLLEYRSISIRLGITFVYITA